MAVTVSKSAGVDRPRRRRRYQCRMRTCRSPRRRAMINGLGMSHRGGRPDRMGRLLSQRDLNRATLARQLLLAPVDLAVPEAVEHLCGLQAQTTTTWYVGLWSRLEGFTPAFVVELMKARKLVRVALMRSTIHLVTDRDCLTMRPLVQMVSERSFATNCQEPQRIRSRGDRGSGGGGAGGETAHLQRARQAPTGALARARGRLDGTGRPDLCRAGPATAARTVGPQRAGSARPGRTLSRPGDGTEPVDR